MKSRPSKKIANRRDPKIKEKEKKKHVTLRATWNDTSTLKEGRGKGAKANELNEDSLHGS